MHPQLVAVVLESECQIKRIFTSEGGAVSPRGGHTLLTAFTDGSANSSPKTCTSGESSACMRWRIPPKVEKNSERMSKGNIICCGEEDITCSRVSTCWIACLQAAPRPPLAIRTNRFKESLDDIYSQALVDCAVDCAGTRWCECTYEPRTIDQRVRINVVQRLFEAVCICDFNHF